MAFRGMMGWLNFFMLEMMVGSRFVFFFLFIAFLFFFFLVFFSPLSLVCIRLSYYNQ